MSPLHIQLLSSSRSPRRVGALGVVIAACAILLATGCAAEIGGGPVGADPDAEIVDPGVPDAAPIPDAAPEPDAAPPDATPLLACVDSFGMEPGFILCAEEAATCSFNVTTAGRPCREVCATYGADCLDGIDNVSDPGLECIPKDPDPDDCDTEGRNTEICVCSRVSAL